MLKRSTRYLQQCIIDSLLPFARWNQYDFAGGKYVMVSISRLKLDWCTTCASQAASIENEFHISKSYCIHSWFQFKLFSVCGRGPQFSVCGPCFSHSSSEVKRDARSRGSNIHTTNKTYARANGVNARSRGLGGFSRAVSVQVLPPYLI